MSNPNLSLSDVRRNEDAVRAMITMLGGPVGMLKKGVRLIDFVPILDADPSDDLQGLRLFAERMQPASTLTRPGFEVSVGLEPAISPEAARLWLTSSGRYTQEGDTLVLNDEKADHLGLAGHQIAISSEPQRLTEAYKALSQVMPLSPQMVGAIALQINNDYEQHQLPQNE